MKKKGTFSNLTRNQKETIGILSMGTFLEYFDLMLYMHMAYFLNSIFFPETDPETARILEAIGISSAIIFRPIGALVFGYIGDKYGRKCTVILTTTLMSISCFTMSVLPTYAQVGIIAAWAVSACRVIQGISSMGEATAAEIYITESTQPPVRYAAASIVDSASGFGELAALAVASMIFKFGLNWRYAFVFGGFIAIIGMTARTRLRETKDFADAQNRVSKIMKNNSDKKNMITDLKYWKEDVKFMVLFCFFLLEAGLSVTFYFSYTYCAEILRTRFGFSQEEVIQQNFFVSLSECMSWIIIVFVSYKIKNPINILKFKAVFFSLTVLISPFILIYATNPMHILFLQICISGILLCSAGVYPMFFKMIPVFKRFTSILFVGCISRAIMFGLPAFSFIYLEKYFGYWGCTWLFLTPVAIAFWYGTLYFSKISKNQVASDDHFYKNDDENNEDSSGDIDLNISSSGMAA